MLTRSGNTLRASHHPSLLSLQQALTAAESGVPAQPVQLDRHEQCAQQLIAHMQAGYKKAILFNNWQDIPSPQGGPVCFDEMAAVHV